MRTYSLSSADVLSTPEGTRRRKERNEAPRDFLKAVQYGQKERGDPGPRGQTWKYTYEDIVYLTNNDSTMEIMNWPTPCCGIHVEKVTITPEMQRKHEENLGKLQDLTKWTSHVVVVVDQSGSMRKTDTNEEATRSDVVWLALALDFVGKRLECEEASGTDVLSLIVMRNEATILLRFQPMDWVLYNKIIDFLRGCVPMSHGNYLPCLDEAENLLKHNEYGGCALLLVFLSDGRPSDRFIPGEENPEDKNDIRSLGQTLAGSSAKTLMRMSVLTNFTRKRVGKLASRFGRRLSLGAIAFGQPGIEDFSTLKAFAEAAKQYGSNGSFHSTSLSVDALAHTLLTLSSTLSTTKMELTEMGSKRQRRVRDVLRESVEEMGGNRVTDSWFYCTNDEDSPSRRRWERNVVRTKFTEIGGWKPFTGRNEFMHPGATGVAVKRKIFGEGQERMVREFREVKPDGTFIGPRMVGKESRFILDISNNNDVKEFHKIFCKTQQKAQKLAQAFNRSLMNLDESNENTPTIEFLDCCVYMVNHPRFGRVGLLVEKMLDIERFQYKKWNNNYGFVDGQEESNLEYIGVLDDAKGNILSIVEEDEETDVESDEDTVCKKEHDTKGYNINVEDIPQAFSCFSFHASGGKSLVCDLQGIYNTSCFPAKFEMTDPAIHYSSSSGRKHVYGRTDRGHDGIQKFFDNHVHSDLCKLLGCSSSHLLLDKK